MADEYIRYNLSKGNNLDIDGTILRNWINSTNLSKIIITDIGNRGTLQNASNLFFNQKNLTDVDLSNAHTESITNMRHMFAGCNNLSTISNFDTSNVNDMYFMFSVCKNLTTIPNFNTSNVTNMGGLFSNCRNLISVPSLNTSNAINMDWMFSACAISDIPMLDMNNVTNIYYMFGACNNLSAAAYANIANMLPLATNLSNQYINNIGLNVNNFTAHQVQILNNKGYIDAIVDTDDPTYGSPVYIIAGTSS